MCERVMVSVGVRHVNDNAYPVLKRSGCRHSYSTIVAGIPQAACMRAGERWHVIGFKGMRGLDSAEEAMVLQWSHTASTHKSMHKAMVHVRQTAHERMPACMQGRSSASPSQWVSGCWMKARSRCCRRPRCSACSGSPGEQPAPDAHPCSSLHRPPSPAASTASESPAPQSLCCCPQ